MNLIFPDTNGSLFKGVSSSLRHLAIVFFWIILLISNTTAYAQNCSIDAGLDQKVCEDQTLLLEAEVSGDLQGDGNITWSQISGPPATITAPNNLQTEITDLIGGNEYIFRISAVCEDGSLVFDDINVTVLEISIADAGDDQQHCNVESTTLKAVPPAGATGQWSQLSGPTTLVFDDENSSSTDVSGLKPGSPSVYVLQWIVTHDISSCETTDQMTIEVWEEPSSAFAGSDQLLCNVTSVRLSANIPVVGSGLWTLISGPIEPNINVPVSPNTMVTGMIPGTYVFRWTITNGPVCTPRSDDVTIIIRPEIVLSGITGATLCPGGQHEISVSASGGSGIYNYQWQFFDESWVNVGANSSSYTTPELFAAVTYQYRVIVSDQEPTDNGGCTATSEISEVVVEAVAEITTQPQALTTLCSGGTTTLDVVAAAAGASSLTYQWQVSVSNEPYVWSDIPNATNPSYTTPALTEGRFYRVIVDIEDNSCDPIVSGVAVVEVNSVTPGSVGSDQSICAGTIPAALTSVANASGSGTISYQWQISTNGTDFTDITGADQPGFSPGSLTSDTWYRRVARSALNDVTCEVASNIVKITAIPAPVVDAPGDFSFCSGQSTGTITFTGSPAGVTFSWVNDNTAIGLAASGTGNIGSFTATNLASSPITANITVTPELSGSDDDCTGVPKVFTITVRPTPAITSPSVLTICSGVETNYTITSSIAGSTFSWTAALQSGTASGFSAGSGNTINQTITNTSNSQAVVRYTITPVGPAPGNCLGEPFLLDVTVNPSAQVNQPTNQVHCALAPVSSLAFTTNRTDGVTTYAWTNSTSAIGLGTAGTGNLPSFTAINNTSSPITATIQVTPTYTNGGISCSGTPVTFTITVNPKGQVNKPDNRVVCAGEPVAVAFSTTNTGGTTTYSWANNNTNIGLPATGTGNLSFTSNGNVTAPVTAEITVTPTFTNAGQSCQGEPQTFTITVVPKGQVNKPANVSVCSDSNTLAINFSSSNTGGVTTYSWTNNNTAIGLVAAGTGNIPSFYTFITGTQPVVATITVTPTFTFGAFSCQGPPEQFTITVNPRPVITSPATLTICDQSAVNYTPVANISNTTFSWTASVISGSAKGFSASGTGPITDVLTNTQASNASSVVRYIITPVGPSGCPGTPFNLDVTVRKCADLAITKTDGNTQFTPGSTIVYTVVVTNNGPSGALGVTVTDIAPTGTTITTWSSVFAGGATGSSNGSGDLTEIINVPRNGTATYTININVPSAFAGNLVNTATVAVPAAVLDPNPANNSATDTNTQVSTADLRLVKTSSPSPVVAGQNLTYTLTLTNDGPSNAASVQVQDVLPGSLTLVSATPSKGTWSAPQWSVGTLTSGETVTLALVATVNSNTTADITNTATASTSTFDPNTQNNTSTVVTPVTTSADLSAAISASPASVIAGQTLTYTIVVANSGPSTARNVAVNDVLPSQLTFVSATPTAGSWNAGSWSIGNLAPGSQATLTLVTTVKSNITAPVTTTATVTSTTPDPNTSNNSASQTTPVSTRADVSITKVADKNTIFAGETVVYTLTVGNAGPSDALNVRVQDVLPSQLELVNVSPGVGSWSAPFWNIGTVARGDVVTMEIEAIVSPGSTGTITNTATVSTNTNDPNASNNTSSHNLTVSASAVLSISKTGPSEIIAGEQIIYPILIGNQGPSNAINVVVTDNIPAGLTSPQFSIDGGNNWNTWNGTYNIATLDAGASFDIRLRATTQPGLNNGQVVTNAASVSSPTAPASAQNSHSTTIRNSADVAVVKTRTEGLVVAGGNIVYNIAVTNLGPSNARNVVATDVLPAQLTFISAVPQQGTWSDPQWNIGTLAEGKTTNMVLTARVNPDVTDGTLILNQVSVASTTPDPNMTNNEDDLSVSVNTQADLAITKSVNNSTPDVGTNVIFTIDVTNRGPSVATGVFVRDQLPSGFTYISHTGGNYNPSNDTWLIGDMAINGTGRLQITARVNTSGSYVNTASVDGNESDPVSSNNVASVTVNPRHVADLTVLKTANVTFQSVGRDVIFTVRVTNNGPSNATNVQVQDQLPAGFTFKSASTVSGSYNSNTGVWSVGNVNAASSATLTITATVNASGPYVNTATVSATQFDPVPGNNSSSVAVSVILANNDNFTSSPVNGFTGGTAGNVLSNDRLQGVAINPALVAISLTSNAGVTGLSVNNTGNLIVPASSPAGNYTVTYQICQVSIPANCDAAEVIFVVSPPAITAADDNFTSTPIVGRVGGVAGNVLTNDRLNNSPVVPSQVAITITQNGGLSGVSINQNGALNVPAATPAGTYEITYRICEIVNPSNCATAKATVSVSAAPIAAVNDDFASNPIDGTTGGIAGNILENDQLNNQPVNLADINLTLQNNGGLTGLSINADGELVVPPGTAAGEYTITYRICEKLNPASCSQATAIVLVSAASIIAVNDTFGPVNGFTGANNAGNILLNDRLNGAAVNINQIDLSVISIHERLTLNVNTGIVGVLPSTPMGAYQLEYRICEKLNPENCDNATVTVNVNAARIEANDDVFGPFSGSDALPNVGSIFANDLLSGLEVTVNLITVNVLSIDSQLTLNLNTGQVGILPGTFEGNYFIEYQICEVLNPTNCDDALVTVIISGANLVANDDAFGPVNGYVGAPAAGNVLDNDLKDGLPVVADDILISVIASGSEKIVLDTITGNLSVLPSIAAGIYELQYQICMKVNPANCDMATVTITVEAPELLAVDDDFGPFNGIAGQENAGNILDNDTLNGQPVLTEEVAITVVSSEFPDGITLDVATGSISIAAFSPSGTFTMVYQICELLNPDNCSQASVSVTIEPFADLSISKTSDIELPEAGEELTFIITVTNLGPAEATEVVVTDQLTTGFIYLSDDSDGAWDPDTGIWEIGELAADAAATLRIRVTLNERGDFSNTATVSASQPDPDLTNNSVEINLAPDANTDLAIEKTVDNLVADVLSNVTFTLTASNQGPGNASDVIVTDRLPDGFTWISHTGDGEYDPITGQWVVGMLSAGESASLDIVAMVNATGNYTNVATITGFEKDPDLSNNTAEVTVSTIPVADLSISKTTNRETASPGSQVVFTLTVSNLGPATATGVEVLDQLPSGYTWISDNSSGSYNPSDGIWSIGLLEKDGVATLEITARVNAQGDYVNTATVSSDVKDPDESNNSSSVTIEIVVEADLELVKTADRQRATVGAVVVFSIAVTNLGPGNATGVQVFDLLPDGFQYVDHTGIGIYNPATGEWFVGDLVFQSSVTLEISARIRMQGDYTNVATVSANESDPVPGNNTDSHTIVVDRELVFPEGFSPNNDGFNDRFLIIGLEQYSRNTLTILNRWGNRVFEASPYQNDWDGTNMFGVTVGGRDLPEGTYFYILEIHEPGVQPVKGFIYLKR